jgi:hypothetical protein
MAQTGKIAVVLFEKTKETYEHQMQLLPLVEYEEPDPGNMQNANNIVWRPVQQHAPVIEGWDLTGLETDIIEETYPSQLGTVKNDFIKQRIDDMRDLRFWERRGKESGKRQATELNKLIAQAVALQGSLFYRSDAVSGYDFIAEAQAMMNERQAYHSERYFVLNDRDNLKFAKDLAGRQTLQGRPEDTWKTGQIGQNVAEFDVYTGSFLPNLVGGASPDTTVTGDQSFVPEAGSVSATGVVTNIDYRLATIPVADSSAYNIGDKVIFDNGGTPVQSIGLADKNPSGQPMTFTIVGLPDGTSVQVYPKPIALDDPAFAADALGAAYANIDTQILNGALMTRLNIDASAKTNIFWDKSAVEVLGGKLPAELFKQYDGMKVITDTMSNGQPLYMVYDGRIEDLTFRYRIFTWYDITVANPSNCGCATTFVTP